MEEKAILKIDINDRSQKIATLYVTDMFQSLMDSEEDLFTRVLTACSIDDVLEAYDESSDEHPFKKAFWQRIRQVSEYPYTQTNLFGSPYYMVMTEGYLSCDSLDDEAMILIRGVD